SSMTPIISRAIIMIVNAAFQPREPVTVGLLLRPSNMPPYAALPMVTYGRLHSWKSLPDTSTFVDPATPVGIHSPRWLLTLAPDLVPVVLCMLPVITPLLPPSRGDRKSTRLNSSHV